MVGVLTDYSSINALAPVTNELQANVSSRSESVLDGLLLTQSSL